MAKKKTFKPKLILRSLIARMQAFRYQFIKTFLGAGYSLDFLRKINKISLQYILKKNGAAIGRNCDIESGLTFTNCINFENLHIGNNVHVGKNSLFDLKDPIIIKDNSTISMGTSFITHIDVGKSNLKEFYPNTSGRIIIHNNTYIGAFSTILMRVEIGPSSVVGAKSLVINNVDPFSIVGGVPAKLIKRLPN